MEVVRLFIERRLKMRPGMFKLVSLLVGINLIFGCAFSETPIKVSIDKSKIKTGEIFVYTINIEGEFISPKIDLPEFKDLKIVSQSQSKNYIFKRGKTIVKITLTYKLMAYNPGIYTIDSVIVEDVGKTFKSETINIEVKGQSLEKREKLDKLFQGATAI